MNTRTKTLGLGARQVGATLIGCPNRNLGPWITDNVLVRAVKKTGPKQLGFGERQIGVKAKGDAELWDMVYPS